MTDYADEAEPHIEERDADGRRVPTGCAPCGCRVVPARMAWSSAAGWSIERVAACELADAEGRPRPAGCTRRLTGMVR